MLKTNKIILGIIVILLLGLLGYGGYLLYNNRVKIKGFLPKDLPGLSELGKSNSPGTLFGPKSSQKAAVLDPEQVIYWTNKYRQDSNLKPLAKNNLLTEASATKVDDMFAKQYFEHVSPSGQKPADLVLSTGYNYKATGENLALGDFKDEKDLVDAWMASPGHRANILNADYTEVGVATGLNNFQDRGQTWLAVQEFGKPSPSCTGPKKTLLNQLDADKKEYNNLVAQANNLYAQANSEIDQGNQIYQTSHEISQAQPYWDKGTADRNQADQLKAQADSLYDQIQPETNQYNSEVNIYNACIAT